jgi:hypothetical protein
VVAPFGGDGGSGSCFFDPVACSRASLRISASSSCPGADEVRKLKRGLSAWRCPKPVVRTFGPHGDWTQLLGDVGYTNISILFNTNVNSDPRSSGEGWFVDGGPSIQTFEVANNTMLGRVSFFLAVATPTNANNLHVNQTYGQGSVHDNYFDPSNARLLIRHHRQRLPMATDWESKLKRGSLAQLRR